jgi:histidine triad (HIT) family protein
MAAPIEGTTSDCIFCRILAGELPASFVYRDGQCAAFMDIQPVNPGHVLVVPVRHGAYLADIDTETAASLMRVGHRAAAVLHASPASRGARSVAGALRKAMSPG